MPEFESALDAANAMLRGADEAYAVQHRQLLLQERFTEAKVCACTAAARCARCAAPVLPAPLTRTGSEPWLAAAVFCCSRATIRLIVVAVSGLPLAV